LRLALFKEPEEQVSSFPHLRTETDPVSETSVLLLGIPDDEQVQNPSDSESVFGVKE
jgi:hypothetical protein